MNRSILSFVSLFALSGAALNATAEEVVVEHTASTAEAPERVYVRSTSSHREEHCFFNKEHDHIHCYDEEPTREVVIVEDRSNRRVIRRHTRYDPVSTGLGVGIAIGLPILVHHAIHNRHYGYSRHRDYRHRNYKKHRWDRKHNRRRY